MKLLGIRHLSGSSSARCSSATGSSGPCTWSATSPRVRRWRGARSGAPGRSWCRWDAHEHPAGHGDEHRVLRRGRRRPPRLAREACSPKCAPVADRARLALACGPSPGARRIPSPTNPHTLTSFRCSGSEKLFAPVTREQGDLTRTPHEQGGCLEDTSEEGVAARAAPGGGLHLERLRGRRRWPAG